MSATGYREKTVAKIIHNFDRTDQLDRDQLVRLCRSIARVCNLTVIDPYSQEIDQPAPAAAPLPGGLKIDRTVTPGKVLAIEGSGTRLVLRRPWSISLKPPGAWLYTNGLCLR